MTNNTIIVIIKRVRSNKCEVIIAAYFNAITDPGIWLVETQGDILVYTRNDSED